MKLQNIKLSAEVAMISDLHDTGQTGLQIFDQNLLNKMQQEGQEIPKDYIQIPNLDQYSNAKYTCMVKEVIDPMTVLSPYDQGGKKAYSIVKDNSYVDKSYIDIIFSSLRSLQAEVARLRNTMRYGMYSYKDEHTALAAMVDDYVEPENEPLWAIDEEDLSPVDGVEVLISEGHSLKPSEYVTAGEGVLSISADCAASWTDETSACKNVPDAKLLLYLTTSNMNTNISIETIANESELLPTTVSSYNIALSSFDVKPEVHEKYNVLFVVSRAHYDNSALSQSLVSLQKYYGKNFIWISIASFGSLNRKVEGYWNPLDNRIYELPLYIGGSSEAELSSNRYFIKQVEFFDLQKIYKFDMYSKYLNFLNAVEPSTPSDVDYKYEVAHITIRSVKDIDVLKKIIRQLPQDELIYNLADNSLYIVNTVGNYKKISGGGGGGEDEGMTEQQISSWLKNNGINLFNSSTQELSAGQQLSVDSHLTIGDITFINDDTKEQFRFTCTADGLLKGLKMIKDTLEKRIEDSGYNTEAGNSIKQLQYRGFVGNLGCREQGLTQSSINNDIRLQSDRIKIGAIYAPNSENRTSYGCSHAYIELENTSDRDFSLDGCYIHYAKQTVDGTVVVEDKSKVLSLALNGVIPAGGTYLIRGKKYCDFDSANCFIKVESFDKEWYEEKVDSTTGLTTYELIDFVLYDRNTWLLTYGFPDGAHTSEDILNTQLISNRNKEETSYYKFNNYRINNCVIDSVSIRNHVQGTNESTKSTITWTGSNWEKFAMKDFDCIYKNTFELDPAKQAFQAFTSKDSSRTRNTNSTDYLYINLTKDIVEFPKTSDTYDIKMFTPKASYEKKNVSTDKTKLAFNKPNMVTCSFGIDAHKTRCFNWISTGEFDEYIWIRKVGSTNWPNRFESYKASANQVHADKAESDVSKKTFSDTVQNAVYNRRISVNGKIYSKFPGCNVTYTAHKCIVDLMESTYTGPDATPIVYEYVVGRADKNGNPDADHTSAVQKFTLYPNDYVPRIYLITDQQGFHWIEYQVWAAAAQELNKTINAECTDSNKIMPILINTGDMTLNGTRINEWLDYYNAGKCLFDHLEQMNVVGNNDLCSPNPEELGTGDDPGKSNGYYFHVFYCYEVTDSHKSTNPSQIPSPIYNDVYIPSLYYFDCGSGNNALRLVMVNSEITIQTCNLWYNAVKVANEETTDKKYTINIYTGWTVKNENSDTSVYDNSDIHIYEILYEILKEVHTSRKIIAVCHEMPFTVLTKDNIATNINSTEYDTLKRDRSLTTDGTTLVGSHLNTLGSLDVNSNYWFSRLLEYFKVKLCLGGHKHTYACTYPLRELYMYTIPKDDGGIETKSSIDGPMPMPVYLSDDTMYHTNIGCINSLTNPLLRHKVSESSYPLINNASKYCDKCYTYELNSTHNLEDNFSIDSSKFPLIHEKYLFSYQDQDSLNYKPCNGILEYRDTAVYPYYEYSNTTDYYGVVYFMLLATGYKLKSNKELPAVVQQFSYIIPKSKYVNNKWDAADELQDPMFAKIEINTNANNTSTFDIYLNKLSNILDNSHNFNLQNYSTDSILSFYCTLTELSSVQIFDDALRYGKWKSDKQMLIQIDA